MATVPGRQGLCQPLAYRRNGQTGTATLDLVEEAHLTFAGTIQASFANAAEFFNSLLKLINGKLFGRAMNEFT